MDNLRQKISDLLDNISISTQSKKNESTLHCMTRRQLIQAIEKQQLEIEELKQTNQDLMSAIIQYIDDLHKINEGNLAIRLKVGACVFGHLADCINLVVEDLEVAIEDLPATHQLKEKYTFSSISENSRSPKS